MKKLLILMTTVAMVACGKNPSNSPVNTDEHGKLNSDGSMTISADVKNASEYPNVAIVKAEGFYEDGEDVSYFVIAEANCDRSKFEITFPATLQNEWLYPAYYMTLPGVTLSDQEAKMFGVNTLFAYDADGEVVFDGEEGDYERWQLKAALEYKKLDTAGLSEEDWLVGWFYVDRDFTLNGTSQSTENGIINNFFFNLTLKQGWNIAYFGLKYNVVSDGDGGYQMDTDKPLEVYYDSNRPNNSTFEWIFGS